MKRSILVDKGDVEKVLNQLSEKLEKSSSVEEDMSVMLTVVGNAAMTRTLLTLAAFMEKGGYKPTPETLRELAYSCELATELNLEDYHNETAKAR